MKEIMGGAERGAAGLTAEEKEEFLDAVAMSFCPECGEEVVQNPKGRRKKFCSEECRFLWKQKHPKPENWKYTVRICPACGKEFNAYREYNGMKRKYCSRSCANHGRAMERRNADGKGTE